MRVIHTSELRECSPRLIELAELQIHDRVGEDQGPRILVAKDELFEDAAGAPSVGRSRHAIRRLFVEPSREVDIDMSRLGSTPQSAPL